VPDDGYIQSHLVWHLGQAGHGHDVNALLHEETPEGQNGWYEAREQLGQTAGYLEDVRTAWRLAEELADSESPRPSAFSAAMLLSRLR